MFFNKHFELLFQISFSFTTVSLFTAMNKHRHYSILPCDSFFFFTISATSDGCATIYCGWQPSSSSRSRKPQSTPTVSIPAFSPVSISVFVSPRYRHSSCFIPSSRQMANAPSGAGFFGVPPARRAPHQNILSQRMSQYSQLPAHAACSKGQPHVHPSL